MVVESSTTLHDLIGIEHCKQGFYQELQRKVEQLKSSNLELEKRRREMQAVLDGITDLMVVISEDMRIQRINHVFKDWFSTEIDPIGKFCYQIFRNNMHVCENCPVQKAFDINHIVKEIATYKVNGRIKQFEIIASPLKSEPTGERQVLLFKRDVTLEKEYQAQFYQAEKMATVGVLAAGVAHEINNPLTAINGFAEGLKRRLEKLEPGSGSQELEDFAEYTDIILKECSRCKEIVKNLLSFSRPVAASLRPVDLNQSVRDTLFILKHHFKEQPRLGVKNDLKESLPWVIGDESQLKQVIINLLTNAIDATSDQGDITVSTRKGEGNMVVLMVKDTGKGIPAKFIDRLFDPFFTTKPVGKGVGVGLSTCYSIVQNHQGSIKVESIVDEGTTFWVTLPGIENEQ